MMSLDIIKRLSADQLAAEALRDAIVTGQLPPGQRITESSLAEQIAVSRSTVRAALHQLSQEGLVVQIPYTGWAVMDFTPRDIWELYTLRSSLESLAAKLATEQLDDKAAEQLSSARDALFAAWETNIVAVVTRRDFELHSCIVSLANNKRLSNQYQMVAQQVRFFVNSTYELDSEMSTVIEHHRPIVDAILCRDKNLAAKLIEEHSISEGEKLVAHMEATQQVGRRAGRKIKYKP